MKQMPGIMLALLLAVPAWLLGQAVPLVGGPVFAILLGILLAGWKRPESVELGLRFTGKKVLQLSIVLLGFEMNLHYVLQVGGQSLVIIAATLSAAFLTAWLVGRWLRLPGDTTILIGVGTAICGGSAIAATAPVIGAKTQDVTYSISTIFLFNIVAVFLFPFLGHLLGLGDAGFGMWAGTAINDTSSVVAAGYSYSDAAGSYATIVKLTRTLMIIPITLALGLYQAKKSRQAGEGFSLGRVFPLFVLGFLAASVVSTSGILGETAAHFLGQAGKFCIAVAMAAIGLNTRLRELLKNGLAPILLGLACWAAVAVVSLLCQHMIGLW